MKNINITNSFFLEVKKDSTMGRGIFATMDIPINTVIEVSDIIVFSKKDSKLIKDSKMILNKYVYYYTKHKAALALGLGSLFNHSKKSNVEYIVKKEKIYFISTKKVKRGEQLFIDYGYDPTKI